MLQNAYYNIYLQTSASIQPRTSPSRFEKHLKILPVDCVRWLPSSQANPAAGLCAAPRPRRREGVKRPRRREAVQRARRREGVQRARWRERHRCTARRRRLCIRPAKTTRNIKIEENNSKMSTSKGASKHRM